VTISGAAVAKSSRVCSLTHHDVARLSELDRVHLFAEACKQAYHHRDALFGSASSPA
jgi:gamma-glutamyltranspeptidase/glutathione hydrolase